jgi:hypothetical protein
VKNEGYKKGGGGIMKGRKKVEVPHQLGKFMRGIINIKEKLFVALDESRVERQNRLNGMFSGGLRTGLRGTSLLTRKFPAENVVGPNSAK